MIYQYVMCGYEGCSGFLLQHEIELTKEEFVEMVEEGLKHITKEAYDEYVEYKDCPEDIKPIEKYNIRDWGLDNYLIEIYGFEKFNTMTYCIQEQTKYEELFGDEK